MSTYQGLHFNYNIYLYAGFPTGERYCARVLPHQNTTQQAKELLRRLENHPLPDFTNVNVVCRNILEINWPRLKTRCLRSDNPYANTNMTLTKAKTRLKKFDLQFASLLSRPESEWPGEMEYYTDDDEIADGV